MIKRSYSDIIKSNQSYFLAREISRPALTDMFAQYGLQTESNYIASSLNLQFQNMIEVLGNSVLERRVLDLGCGSVQSQDYSFVLNRPYEPWLCRFLHKAGSKVVGVDVADNKNELFENYKVDLRSTGALSFLPDESIDLANAFGLFDSKVIQFTPSSMDFEKNLEKELERVLKPDGFFIYNP